MPTEPAEFVRPGDLRSEPLSPELVLVSPPALAALARDRLPDQPRAEPTPQPRIAYALPPPVFTVTPTPVVSPSRPARQRNLRISPRALLVLSVGAALIAIGPLLGHRDQNQRQASQTTRSGILETQTTLMRDAARAKPRSRSTPKVGRARPPVRDTRVSRGNVHLAPAAAAASSRGIRISWPKSLGATYYDVQLYRGSDKIYEAWPSNRTLLLPSRWRFRGRPHSLAGAYVWFVWPGFGDRARAHYGRVSERHILSVG